MNKYSEELTLRKNIHSWKLVDHSFMLVPPSNVGHNGTNWKERWTDNHLYIFRYCGTNIKSWGLTSKVWD